MQRIFNWKATTLFAIVISLLVYFSFASSLKVYLNGTEMTGKDKPFIHNGITYVSLEAVLKDMEIDYEFKDEFKFEIVFTKDEKTYEYNLLKSTVLVDGKEVPISTKTIGENNTVVPSGLKPKLVNYVFFVPVETLEEVLGLELNIVKKNGKTIVNIGKIVNKEQVEPTIPTPPKEFDREIMDKNLVEHYGFVNVGNGVFYNPYTRHDRSYYAIRISYLNPEYEFIIQLNGWVDTYIKEYEGVPERVKYILQHAYPTEYETIFNIVDKWANGDKSMEKYMNKRLKYDDRYVRIEIGNGKLQIVVEKK